MPPAISHVLETCLYVKSITTSVDFYQKLLGVKPFLDTPRIAGFALGPTTLLLFQLGLTASDQHPNPNAEFCIPGHGPSQDIISQLSSASSSSPSSLKQHFCLAVPSRSDIEVWEKHFEANGIKVTGTMEWEKGGRSVYFSDPDDHVGEIGSRGIWAHY